jgi:hypothetical protein
MIIVPGRSGEVLDHPGSNGFGEHLTLAEGAERGYMRFGENRPDSACGWF